MSRQDLKQTMTEMTSRSRDALDRVVTGYIRAEEPGMMNAPYVNRLEEDFTAEAVDDLRASGLVEQRPGFWPRRDYLVYAGGSIADFYAAQQEVPYS